MTVRSRLRVLRQRLGRLRVDRDASFHRRGPAAWLDGSSQDFRDAVRALGYSPAYASWVVGSLAVGMAVTIAALALLNALLLLPFPGVTGQDRLVRVAMSRNCGRPDCWARMSSTMDYDALRGGLTGLQGLAAYTIGDTAVALPAARSMRSVLASANYFDVLGVRPAIGRVFDAAGDRADAPIAVIAHSAWMREFDGDPSVVGQSIRVADRFVEIVGVAADGFAGIDRDRPGAPRSMSAGRAPDLWLPIGLADAVLPLIAAEQRRQERDLYFVGRLVEGIDVSRLQAEAAVIAGRLAATRGDAAQGARAEVLRLWKVNPRHWHLGVIVVMPIPILVLAISCVNAANLMIARGSQRQRDIAIRLAIGAGRGRIVRQLLMESALLAACAAALAVGLAWCGLQLASSPMGGAIPIDTTVLVLTIMTAAGTTLAFGLAPAVRVSAQRPSSALGTTGARSDVLPQQSRMRRLLVVAQVALSLALLASGSQLVATVRSQAVSGGTPADRLLLARFDLQAPGTSPTGIDGFYRDLAAGAARIPGVSAVGLARHTSVWTLGRGTASSVVVWRPGDGADDGHVTIGGYAGGDLFDAVGLRVTAGRVFTEADRQTRPQVAVINETAAGRIEGPALNTVLRVAPRNRGFDESLEVRVVEIG